MIEHGYYSQEMHCPDEVHDIGNLELEEGGTIRGCELAYAAFGSSNEAKGSATLFQHGIALPIRSSNRSTSDRDARSI